MRERERVKRWWWGGGGGEGWGEGQREKENTHTINHSAYILQPLQSFQPLFRQSHSCEEVSTACIILCSNEHIILPVQCTLYHDGDNIMTNQIAS